MHPINVPGFMRYYLMIILLLGIPGLLPAQSPVSLNGYVTSMQTTMFEEFDGYWQNDQLLHHRLNFKWYAGDMLTVSLEMRTRLFTGDNVRNPAIPYAGVVDHDDGWVDMSWNVVDERSFLWNSMLDRAYASLHLGKLDVQIGRQRINWGQTFVWNPNDIFNAYSFFDFDYVERPGSDAVRLMYYPTFTSVFETALKVNHQGYITAAGFYRFNAWGYDLQLLMGIMNEEDYIVGGGWSGAIDNTSFRGEFTYFQSIEENDPHSMALMSLGVDHTFQDHSSLQAEALVSTDTYDFDPASGFMQQALSIKQQAFSRLSMMGQYTYSISPIWNVSLSGIWYPDLDGFYAGPSTNVSVTGNLEFSVFYQHFNGTFVSGEQTSLNLVFLRFKQSF